MKSFAQIDIEQNGEYLNLLSAIAKLSGLFSESSIPFINYRVAENIFCRSFNAHNLSRSDTAFDANYNSVGIGLKTFTCKSDNSTEKIAEFNSLSRLLSTLKGKELAIQLSTFRNERINLAKRLYKIDSSLYHIVARSENELRLYETDYNTIDIHNIRTIKETKSSLKFEDGNHFYTFNFSKSTLFRKFIVPQNAYRLPIDIIDDPFAFLVEFFENNLFNSAPEKLVRGINFVILPLYGIKNKEKFVFEQSGLNQWNANGRKRAIGEIYIPIPIEIHKYFPNFFPSRDTHFNLTIPSGETYKAKICQDKSKALMTTPNQAMSNWLLRKVLQLKEGELATIEKLDELGFDSVIIIKSADDNFKIDIMKTGSYSSFISHI